MNLIMKRHCEMDHMKLTIRHHDHCGHGSDHDALSFALSAVIDSFLISTTIMKPFKLEGSEDINYPCPVDDLEGKVVREISICIPPFCMSVYSGAHSHF